MEVEESRLTTEPGAEQEHGNGEAGGGVHGGVGGGWCSPHHEPSLSALRG